MVFATGSVGELGISPRHAPLITQLKPGPVRVQQPNGEEAFFFVGGGILEVMPHIITAPSPMLAAAQVNTMAEFDSAFRSIVKTNAYQAQKVLLVSGVNIDISPNHDEVFPLTKFAPWAAYYKDEHGAGQVWEQAELVERLLAQPLDNPEQIDLEEAIATMSQTPDIDIIWPS